jgi:hypothetical protein
MEVTYDETRLWTYWLNTFTISDLSDAMGVEPEVIVGHLVGLVHNGTIEDTGDYVNGSGPKESILSFVPLPPGPSEHHTETPPERTTDGVYELAPVRGYPIRIWREDRRKMSTPGQRMHIIRKQDRYEKMMQKRAEKEQRREERRQRKLQYRD